MTAVRPVDRTWFPRVPLSVEVSGVMLNFMNARTGAEVHLGRTGAGYYVEARHPDFSLPFRKTYEWFQHDMATRDFELLRAVVADTHAEREPAVIG